MNPIDRRAFVQLTAGAMLTAAANRLPGATAAPVISSRDGQITVNGANYTWSYTPSSDTFHLLDAKNRSIATGKMQPAIVVAPSGDAVQRVCSPGRPTAPSLEPGRVTVVYEAVNGAGTLSMAWRFDENGIWTEPLVYDAPAGQDVVSLHYFSEVSGERRTPSLYSSYIVAPGMLSGSSISPIVREYVHIDEDVWLGRGSFIPGLSQQWGLPVHYFCGFSSDPSHGQRAMLTNGRSDSFACGLADLPGGDLFLHLYEGKCSPWIDYRSDLWHHLRGPGPIKLGATLLWVVAADYYEAIAAYYQGLLRAGVIHRHENSPKKTAVSLTPQFCTWGVQVDRNHGGERLNEEFLTGIYEELKASGMKAGLFSIDDKWEGTYGKLEHSVERFPHFEQFLDRLRADRMHIGMWAALMRCERPADLGLTEDNMLKRPDGSAYLADFGGSRYYILDFTQPAVARVLGDLARRFIRRYKPDLLKFDFGYELPTVATAGPADRQWTGERLMARGLEVVIKAMREENPDLVVMYYNLSPLFLDYFDLHSPDDLYMAAGEYDLEANRRFFFSSLLGPLGVSTYGSTGYDWASAPAIWFDAAAVGTIGSLNDFKGDEQGETSTPELIARYNGISKLLRPGSTFEIVPLDTVSLAPTRGAHARSWARFEGGQLVLLAYRPPMPGEEDPLARRDADTRILSAVESTMPVVVASRTSESLARCKSLAIVAYGKGELVIRRQQGKLAEVTTHYFGGAVAKGRTVIEEGRLRLSAVQHSQTGDPIEWIEVHIP